MARPYSRMICWGVLVALSSVWVSPQEVRAAESHPVRLTLSGEGVATASGPHVVIAGEDSFNIPGTLISAAATPPDCTPHCCQAIECRLEKSTKAHSHPIYRCREKEVCLPRCGWVLFGACEECADCGLPRTKRVLLKKIVTEQRPAVVCKPVAKN